MQSETVILQCHVTFFFMVNEYLLQLCFQLRTAQKASLHKMLPFFLSGVHNDSY